MSSVTPPARDSGSSPFAAQELSAQERGTVGLGAPPVLADPTTTVLSARGLVKTFGRVVGLDGVDLDLFPGEVLSITTLADGPHAGREVLVPFIEQFVPTVDLAAGTVVITPPDGLLDITGGTDGAAADDRQE